mgnify:CR=1 FL=1
MKTKTPEYYAAFELARSDVDGGWFDPSGYSRQSLVNHLVGCDNYSLEFLEGYCDGAFA